MDIQRWLEGTTLPHSPEQYSPAKQIARPASQHFDEHRGRSPRQARKRTRHQLSDSSFIEPDGPLAPVHTASSQHAGNQVAIESEASDKSPSRPSVSVSGNERTEKGFERRPRHKTRADLYELKREKHKERKSRTHKDGKDRKESSKCKLKRRKSRPNVGTVQTYHAKNVSKSRLTLKPGSNIGLYRKGRASIPVKGRGLPDLVFSEMKFLQKRKETEDEQTKADAKSKPRKKHRAQVNEDEISAYFAPKRPPLTERDNNGVAKPIVHHHNKESGMSKHSIEYEKFAHSTFVVPTVELPDKPYLGFGSKGVAAPTSSNYTWSESAQPPPDVLPERRQRSSRQTQAHTTPSTGLAGVEVSSARAKMLRGEQVSESSVPENRSNVPQDQRTAQQHYSRRELSQDHASTGGFTKQIRTGRKRNHSDVNDAPSPLIRREIPFTCSANVCEHTTHRSPHLRPGEASKDVETSSQSDSKGADKPLSSLARDEDLSHQESLSRPNGEEIETRSSVLTARFHEGNTPLSRSNDCQGYERYERNNNHEWRQVPMMVPVPQARPRTRGAPISGSVRAAPPETAEFFERRPAVGFAEPMIRHLPINQTVDEGETCYYDEAMCGDFGDVYTQQADEHGNLLFGEGPDDQAAYGRPAGGYAREEGSMQRGLRVGEAEQIDEASDYLFAGFWRPNKLY